MEDELYLTDLVNVEVLQRIQDAFANLTGMASLTTDINGTPVTKGSNFTDFCTKYTRSTPAGRERCEKCDKFGAHATWESGHPTTYYCHAGLIDYAAPIIADGRLVGCFIGGQVLDKAPDLDKIRKVAEEIGVDPDGLADAACKVNIMNKEKIDNSAQFLYTIANILSDMAYGNYLSLHAQEEIQRVANMKSDFLANMSHEIRTPMNAVIGMAEMALREEISPNAREYINQIRTSGKALLTIINDILDFSKIESGKMDIIPAEYEPMSIVNDVTNILLTRLKDKDVELILDISPNIPHKLYGDNIRIKQVLLNLGNNAVKFTKRGKVVIHMYSVPLSENMISLCVSVEDSGIGIKKEDMAKLFQSFQQVDSKRNRNIEGTGLGLAISRRLMTLMGGELHVESQYEKGSTFSFSLPQKIIESANCIQVNRPDLVLAGSLLDNPYIKQQLKQDCVYLGVEYHEFESVEEIAAYKTDKNIFLFVEQQKCSNELEDYLKCNLPVTAVQLTDTNAVANNTMVNLLSVKKPLYTLNESMIFNRESLHFYDEDSDTFEIDFIAPTAEVLVVDDNAVNLTVAEGLLEPLKMKVETVLSGKEAIGKISVHHYDIVFMDHMMPELDGIETTHIIRRFHPEYNDVPIIALTANAVEGVKEKFLSEGMNDFIAKPVEFKTLIMKVKEWLPIEKVQRVNEFQSMTKKSSSNDRIVIGDLDTKTAIKLLGNEKVFRSVLKEYYKAIDKKSRSIREMLEKEDWAGYTIEVHALKSSSRQIGALSLSDKAADLEKAGNARDIEKIRQCTDDMLRQYRDYLPVLKPFCEEENEDTAPKKEIAPDALRELFDSMRGALDNLDIDAMESVYNEMNKYQYSENQKQLLDSLRNAIDEIDVDTCGEIIERWEVIAHWESKSKPGE